MSTIRRSDLVSLAAGDDIRHLVVDAEDDVQIALHGVERAIERARLAEDRARTLKGLHADKNLRRRLVARVRRVPGWAE